MTSFSFKACCIPTGRFLMPQGHHDRACWTAINSQGCQTQAQILAAAPATAVCHGCQCSCSPLTTMQLFHARQAVACWGACFALIIDCLGRSILRHTMPPAQREGAKDSRFPCVAVCPSAAALFSTDRIRDVTLACVAIDLCSSLQCQKLVCPRQLQPLTLLGRGAGWHVCELLVSILGQGRPVPHKAAPPQLLAAVRGRGFCRAAWQ